jgi:hypothetical protein
MQAMNEWMDEKSQEDNESPENYASGIPYGLNSTTSNMGKFYRIHHSVSSSTNTQISSH